MNLSGRKMTLRTCLTFLSRSLSLHLLSQREWTVANVSGCTSKPSSNEKGQIRQMIHQHPSDIIHTSPREDKVYPEFKINFLPLAIRIFQSCICILQNRFSSLSVFSLHIYLTTEDWIDCKCEVQTLIFTFWQPFNVLFPHNIQFFCHFHFCWIFS